VASERGSGNSIFIRRLPHDYPLKVGCIVPDRVLNLLLGVQLLHILEYSIEPQCLLFQKGGANEKASGVMFGVMYLSYFVLMRKGQYVSQMLKFRLSGLLVGRIPRLW